jgi:hypothetical protein
MARNGVMMKKSKNSDLLNRTVMNLAQTSPNDSSSGFRAIREFRGQSFCISTVQPFSFPASQPNSATGYERPQT